MENLLKTIGAKELAEKTYREIQKYKAKKKKDKEKEFSEYLGQAAKRIKKSKRNSITNKIFKTHKR